MSQPKTAAQIRTAFLEFFKKNGHTVVESSSLVPHNDPTLLFTNAGMVQFKDVFLGKDQRAYSRATTSQKCVRAGGKHNDLENVGFTARHHTFFEMLGNFSFGDYFKKEAIRFAWQFVTQELKLPTDRLYVSVYKDDDEAALIWEKQEGVPQDRIFRFGEKDNFWSMGDTGPCGPCSELFIDRGAKYAGPDCKPPAQGGTCTVGCDCDRYMEFWNLVFMQYDRDASGKLTPLPKPSVDTGAGLERIASILQDAATNYDTDLFQAIIQRTEAIAHQKYDPTLPIATSFRVIADHSRAVCFLIADGVMPSNEGRGYVLRRIMRRAIRHGKKLGLNESFLHKTVGFVIDQMKDAYPDLVDKRSFIERATLAEEEQFLKTLERGLELLDDETRSLKKGSVLKGEVAFKLYDTYGFPLDLTRVILDEKGMSIDEPGFEREMTKQREESRKHWKGSGDQSGDDEAIALESTLRSQGKLPVFKGYDATEAESVCIAILNTRGPDDTVQAVFAETPFYGESGGQVGDRGKITGSDGFAAEVLDVRKPAGDLIVAQLKVLSGHLQVGKLYLQQTDRQVRALTARNHTATHLLHWALREVLGAHVKQAGSLVNAELLRFDFAHFQAMTREELKQVEDLINQKIWSDDLVSKKEMNKDEALKSGAIAFFGDKYGDRVRVVSVGKFSTEFCGGTHVDRASDIHFFKIINENGIAAGVRRIIAYTSEGAFRYLREKDEQIKAIRDRLKASSADEILDKLDKLVQQEKDLRKQIEKMQSGQSANLIQEMIATAKTINGIKLLTGEFPSEADGMKRLREITDQIKQRAPDHLLVIAMKEAESGKALLMVAVGPKASAKLHAGNLLKELAPLIDGKGGGKNDFAQAGGTKPAGFAEAFKKSETWLQKQADDF